MVGAPPGSLLGSLQHSPDPLAGVEEASSMLPLHEPFPHFRPLASIFSPFGSRDWHIWSVQVGLDFGASLMEEVMKALNMSDDVSPHVNDHTAAAGTTTTSTTSAAADDDDDDDEDDDDDTVSGGSDSDSRSSTSTQTDDQQLDPDPSDINTTNDQPGTSCDDVLQSTGPAQSTATRVILRIWHISYHLEDTVCLCVFLCCHCHMVSVQCSNSGSNSHDNVYCAVIVAVHCHCEMRVDPVHLTNVARSAR